MMTKTTSNAKTPLNCKQRRAAKRNSKTLVKRKKEQSLLMPFAHEVIAFNDHYHLRITASNGDIIDYFPVSEKYRKKGATFFLNGLSNLIDYLNEVS